MKRLTEKHFSADDYYMVCSENCANDAEMCGGCPWLEKIINRLGAYEDSGLEPEAVAQLKKIPEIFNCDAAEPAQLKQLLVRLRGLAEAERDNRLVVLPWAIGQTIYEADPEHGVVKHTLQNAIWDMASIAVDDAGHTWDDYWCSDDVSLAYATREEAEALCRKLGVDYYIKDSLRREMEAQKGGEGD